MSEAKIHINLTNPENWDLSTLKALGVKYGEADMAPQFTTCLMIDLPEHLLTIWHGILDMFRDIGTQSDWIASNALIYAIADTDNLICEVCVLTNQYSQKKALFTLAPGTHPGALEFFSEVVTPEFWLSLARRKEKDNGNV